MKRFIPLVCALLSCSIARSMLSSQYLINEGGRGCLLAPWGPLRNFCMELLLKLVIVGLSTGAIYALIALGYTMVYGIIELINFAHGDIFMIGSMVSISIMGAFGITGTGLEGKVPTGFALAGILLLSVDRKSVV